jgi:hypothetical protein
MARTTMPPLTRQLLSRTPSVLKFIARIENLLLNPVVSPQFHLPLLKSQTKLRVQQNVLSSSGLDLSVPQPAYQNVLSLLTRGPHVLSMPTQ